MQHSRFFGFSCSAVLLLGTQIIAQANALASPYRLPYPAGVEYDVSRGITGDPVAGHQFLDVYNQYAIDFQMPIGSDVTAARGGTVLRVKEDSNISGNNESFIAYGNYIVIDHGDGESTLYLHLQQNSVLVNPGDVVTQGQLIGKSGNTGYSTGPHLHYTVQRTPTGSSPYAESLQRGFSDVSGNGIPTGSNRYISENTTILQDAIDVAEEIYSGGDSASDGRDTTLNITRGETQEYPVLPSEKNGVWKSFFKVLTGLWFDPPAQSGLEYQALESSLFKSLKLPVGLDADDQYTVAVGNTMLGNFSGGQEINFLDFSTNGVDSFKLLDIQSETGEPLDLPVLINFNEEFGSFRVRSVPEPGSLIGLSFFAVAVLGGVQKRRGSARSAS